ncbi:MAG: Gfo/Idh/MocA family oxidoreductase [Kiritimatiellaeota bacterium]|nr:Gfo/Idh/MocA family oxidoreductase [Kiritimatiellota bacterium]
MHEREVSRRTFLASSAAGAAFAAMPLMGAAARRRLKIALIGCGGRGTGATANCLEAGKTLGTEVRVVAVADVFEARARRAGERFGVAPERWFHGFSAYRNVLETEADIVLLATPPNFRPVHLEAAVNAAKHVFMEKPVAVDPPGVRRIIAAGETAKQKGLSIVAGTQRRHQGTYLRNAFLAAHGVIGEIVAANVYWCGGRLWYKPRLPNEPDALYMVRNWVSFTEMSGDHIVEQHVHNLDVANWFIGRPPVAALGFGGRARRKTGDQYDFFSIDYDYGDGVHVHSMCRQINRCYNAVREFFIGTEGTMWGGGKIQPTLEKDIAAPKIEVHANPYVEEHRALLRSVIQGEPVNESRNVAESTLTGIMGRISAYTGQLVRWSDCISNPKGRWYSLALKPTADDFEKGPVVAPPDDVVALPGAS